MGWSVERLERFYWLNTVIYKDIHLGIWAYLYIPYILITLILWKVGKMG